MEHYSYFHSELFSPQWISIPKAIFPSFQFNLNAITVKNSGNNALICKMNSASFHYGFPFRSAHFLMELYTFTWNKNVRIFPYFDSLKRRNWNCMNECCHKPFYYCRLFSSFDQVFRGKGSSFDEKIPVLMKMFDEKAKVLMKRLPFWPKGFSSSYDEKASVLMEHPSCILLCHTRDEHWLDWAITSKTTTQHTNCLQPYYSF